jgi:hypothetical protein
VRSSGSAFGGEKGQKRSLAASTLPPTKEINFPLNKDLFLKSESEKNFPAAFDVCNAEISCYRLFAPLVSAATLIDLNLL